MKSDVMMTQHAEDLSRSVVSKSRLDETTTRLRRWGANCRLADQIEAEQVVLSSDIEARLRLDGVWLREQSETSCTQDFSAHVPTKFSSKMDGGVAEGDELDWTRTSDDGSPLAVVGGGEDFRNGTGNCETGSSDYQRPRMPSFLERSRVLCAPQSPHDQDQKVLETSLGSSPMENEISSYFSAAKKALERTSDSLSAKIQGLSPRQRLLYRYQQDELMTNGNQLDAGRTQDESVRSTSPQTSADAPLDGGSSFPGFVEQSESQDDWEENSRSDGGVEQMEEEEEEEEEPVQHSTTGLLRDCHICGYSPCSRDDYDSHMKKTHFTHKCHLCIYWSRSPGRLNRHMKNFHSEPGDTPANKKPRNPRKYTCKQCDFFTYVQEEIWNHTRVHVPASKLLSCPHCPFVCAFKHHMQYHMNNHLGYKPFKCSECNYRCNNKSMLNSHKKSHSNDYPYRCGVCNYAAKYRHALNIHLRKKKHVADGEVLLEDRHRPGRIRNTSSSASVARNRVSLQQQQQHLVPQVGLNMLTEEARYGVVWPEPQIAPLLEDYDAIKQEPERVISMTSSYLPAKHVSPRATIQPPLIPISDLSHVQQLQFSSAIPRGDPFASATAPLAQNHALPELNGELRHSVIAAPQSLTTRDQNSLQFGSVRQLSTIQNYRPNVYENHEQLVTVLPPSRHFPLETVQDNGRYSVDEWPLDLTKSKGDKKANKKSWEPAAETAQPDWYECQHCGIIFPDSVLYSMHMEYHCDSDPFLCNLCGQRTKDRREFFNHISQVAHN